MKKSVKKNKNYDGVKRTFTNTNTDTNTNVVSSSNKKRRIENIVNSEEMKGLPIDIIGEVLTFLNNEDFLYLINPPSSTEEIELETLMIKQEEKDLKKMQDKLETLINEKNKLDPLAKEQIKELEQSIKIQVVEVKKKQMELKKPKSERKKKIRREIMQTYPSKEDLLGLKNLSQFNVEVQFTMLILLFVIYDSYVPKMEISLDLQKKLMVFFCLEEEKAKRETLLSSLLEINKKITTENYNLSKATEELIKTEKQKIEAYVENYYLIKENDTANRVYNNKEKKLISDCSSSHLWQISNNLRNRGQTLTFYVKANSDYHTIQRAVVYGFNKEIGDDCCSIVTRLESIKFLLPLLEKVGDRWLYGCFSLTDVDFTGLSSLKYVGDSWLSRNDSLTTVDFSALTKLISVGSYWLHKCHGVITLNFAGLTSLKTVDNFWIHVLDRLTDVDFTGLTSLQTVGEGWLWGNASLATVNFTGLTFLKTVGSNWLRGNHTITTVNFTGLTSLQTVGYQWLYDNFSLTTVNLTGLTSLEKVGHDWLRYNESLTTVNFTGLTSLIEVDSGWLLGNTSLTIVNFTGLTSLKQVGNGWLYNNASLTTVNFAGLTSLETVGHYWLSDNQSLTDVNFTGLTFLKRVGNYWLSYNNSLTTVNFTGLSSLKQVGSFWLYKNNSLTTINFTGLTSLEQVGLSGWLEENENLLTVTPIPTQVRFINT